MENGAVPDLKTKKQISMKFKQTTTKGNAGLVRVLLGEGALLTTTDGNAGFFRSS
jgi:hypothetical protein